MLLHVLAEHRCHKYKADTLGLNIIINGLPNSIKLYIKL